MVSEMFPIEHHSRCDIDIWCYQTALLSFRYLW